MALEESPLPYVPEGRGALCLCYEKQIPSKRFWGGGAENENSALGRTPHNCLGLTLQELAFKTFKTKKSHKLSCRGACPEPSWSMPLLFCGSRGGRHLVGCGVPGC